ncbi:MAG: putative sulfate exporter family transporter [Actinomycetota bacterium]
MQEIRPALPGLGVVVVGVALAFAFTSIVDVSTLVVGVVLGAIAANAGVLRPTFDAGIAFASKRLLRAGIVLLGLRLSMDEVRALGIEGAVAVVIVVLATFFGVQALARAMGVSQPLGLLVATGYSICGASAVAAMEPLTDADEEETAYAIGLVTLCGTMSIFVFPLVGRALGMSDELFGTWVGAGVHDVGQVTATASAFGATALATATLVKLTRVVLLAPMVFGVGYARRRRLAATNESGDAAAVDGADDDAPNVPLVPLFVVLFLGAIALRATGWLSDGALSAARDLEEVLLTAGMFGLGAGVRFGRLRRLGGRPLVLGVVSWVLVSGAAMIAAYVVA